MASEKSLPLSAEFVLSQRCVMNCSSSAMWSSGSLNFPENASKIVADKMKGFILGIPYMLPCDSCSEHARAYIQTNYDNLDEICLGRKTLVNFFYNFHNFVNKRLGKPQLSFEEAMNLYRGSVTVISSIQKV